MIRLIDYYWYAIAGGRTRGNRGGSHRHAQYTHSRVCMSPYMSLISTHGT